MLAKIAVVTMFMVGSTMAVAVGIGLGGGYGGLGGGYGGLGGGYGGLGGGYGGLGGGYGSSGYSRQSIVTAHAAPAVALHAAPIAVAHAAPIAVAHAAPVAVATHAKQVIDYVDTHPAYEFDYAVHDAHTGDVKSQKEVRDGDVVHGSYSLIEPDGTKRIVEYTADPHNGFNAIVHREHNAHPQVIQKVAVAPVAVKAAPYLAYHH